VFFDGTTKFDVYFTLTTRSPKPREDDGAGNSGNKHRSQQGMQSCAVQNVVVCCFSKHLRS